ncbi:MAG: hypothetical protein LW809_06820 [Vampirovibrionales bacterium]|nr:hypothetical protein [Vampirovibrionales bacterium]
MEWLNNEIIADSTRLERLNEQIKLEKSLKVANNAKKYLKSKIREIDPYGTIDLEEEAGNSWVSAGERERLLEQLAPFLDPYEKVLKNIERITKKLKGFE